jgi:hypothetical protein
VTGGGADNRVASIGHGCAAAPTRFVRSSAADPPLRHRRNWERELALQEPSLRLGRRPDPSPPRRIRPSSSRRERGQSSARAAFFGLGREHAISRRWREGAMSRSQPNAESGIAVRVCDRPGWDRRRGHCNLHALRKVGLRAPIAARSRDMSIVNMRAISPVSRPMAATSGSGWRRAGFAVRGTIAREGPLRSGSRQGSSKPTLAALPGSKALSIISALRLAVALARNSHASC